MWLLAIYSAGLTVTVLRVSRWYNRLVNVGSKFLHLERYPHDNDN